MGNLFSVVSNPMEAALVDLALFVGSAGVAIILFTVIVRLILSPLQIVQLRSARAMQRLQPHIAELRKKHGKDKQKLTEETMKLYKEHKVNPAMGCLPMLLQFPVLIGLFWALRALGTYPTVTIAKGASIAGANVGLKVARRFPSCLPHPHVGTSYALTPSCWDTINGHGAHAGYWLANTYHSYSIHVYNLYHAHFLWLSNGLGQHDPLYILPVLAGVTQWIQSRMMMQKSSDPQQQTMNMMMNFTPLIIVFFAANYASGLSLYWVTSTVIGILVSIKITGWGSLPRFDRMLFGQSQPARSFIGKSSTGKSSAPMKGLSSDIGASNLKAPSPADGSLSGGDGEVSSAENGDGGTGDPKRSQRSNQRASSRRRSGRPRGGRRG